MTMSRQSGSRSRAALAVVVVLTAAVGVVAVAFAAKPSPVASTLTLKTATTTAGGHASYSGRIKVRPSKYDFCKKKREVQVYDATTNPDDRLAKVYSDKRGRWRTFSKAPPSGHDIYALVEAKITRHSRILFKCLPDRSNSLTFPTP